MAADKMNQEDGYDLWLRYQGVNDPERLTQYRQTIQNAVVLGESETVEIIRSEIAKALPALLGQSLSISTHDLKLGSLIFGTVGELRALDIEIPQDQSVELVNEGYLIRTLSVAGQPRLLVTGNTHQSVLTGTFHLLRLIQTHQDIRYLNVSSCPRIGYRILAHWDNIDSSIERGYAGKSLWNWEAPPDDIDPRYHDYARACASIGINGTCLNNVNAQPESLSTDYLVKTAALADVFRPYGIRVYLSPLFSAPMLLGSLPDADPRDPAVAEWWSCKVDQIYSLIPDFGGFQVKANSEGQPGPQDYGANHDDGANLLAEILEPYGGIVLWRAFVYDTSVDEDRARCGYKEFVPLDGKFHPNVIVQTKNGPIDFQPREPFHPLFGALEKTPLALELQITQEYLGQSKHLVYLAGMWKEVLDSDTYARGPGSTVGDIVSGSVFSHNASSIVGVANTGSVRNWCGHHFSQANWYAFGRLAWDYSLSAEDIADEWVRMTWSNDPAVIDQIKFMLLGSWQACINYMTPLGLHHIMQEGHHYGPDPAFNAAPRKDWNNVYYHRADKAGIGFDRSTTGSNAVSQYHNSLSQQFDKIDSCPEKYLLWFHHVPWGHRMKSGRTLWEELQHCYVDGVGFVEEMLDVWCGLRDKVDAQRYEDVHRQLILQLENARLWRDVCTHYFGQFATRSLGQGA